MNDFIRNTSIKKPLTDSMYSINEKITNVSNNASNIVSSIADSNITSLETSKSGINIWNIIKYIIVIAILIFLGINLYSYLGKDNSESTESSSSLPEFDNNLENEFNEESEGEIENEDLDDKFENTIEFETVNKEKKITELDKKYMNEINKKRGNPSPDSVDSTIQSNKSLSKSGFCYIGEYKGIRSCINVGEGDKCMSGDIFPTKEICINPNLRQ